ncbi:hypothetical protein ACLB2K_007327 [Fragaria x ananassa]
MATLYLVILEGNNDANWISDMKDSKSTSGYVFILGDATMSWKSSRQIIPRWRAMHWQAIVRVLILKWTPNLADWRFQDLGDTRLVQSALAMRGAVVIATRYADWVTVLSFHMITNGGSMTRHLMGP